jgi:spermidine/putrescine transport system substrate-binding protein
MNRRVFITGAGLTGAMGFTASCARDRRPRLNVFNWSSYIDPEMISAFERERGVRIRYGTYESNEEMLAKVITGNSGWDIVFPTHSRLAPMAAHGLIAPLDHRRLPLLPNLDARFEQPAWDPALRLGVPYMWNATGIVYNRAQAPAATGWSALWNPVLRGRLTMLDDPEDAIGAGLLKLRFPFASTDDRQLGAARASLVEQKRLLRAYINAEVRDQLVAGDVITAQLWSTTSAQAIHANPELEFIYPAEGFPLYCDCAVILAESGRHELAHEFLNYLLRPNVAVANARAAETATANGAAQTLIPHDPVLYPGDSDYARGVWPTALPSEAQRYRDRLWTEIKAA